MKIEEALKYADAATQGATFYEGMTGPLMTMAVLAAEVRRYQKQEAEAIQNKLDDETRKLVLELCDMVQRSEGTSMAMIDAAQNIEAKLGAGNVK